MVETTCPQCGFVQQNGEECARCGVIFRRLRSNAGAPPPRAHPRPMRAAEPARNVPAPREDDDAPRPSLVWRAYRVVRWAVLVALIVVVLLMLRTAAPPEVATDATAPRRVAAKMDEAAQAVSLGASHTLALDEAELNALLAQNLALAPPPGSGRAAAPQGLSLEEGRSNVRDVRVQLVDDRVSAWLLFDFHGKQLTLTLEARLAVRDGRLQISPIAGWLGKLPLPQAALERGVRRALDDPANASNLTLPPEIRGIRVEGSQLKIDWHGDGRPQVSL